MKRALFALGAASLFAVVLGVRVAHAGEDPVIGVASAVGQSKSVGCVDTSTAVADAPHLPRQLAFQCLDCRVRYRQLTEAQYTTGIIVPTDGGPLIDGGVWGPLVDFQTNPDPYRVNIGSGQTRICFYAEDAGPGWDAGLSSFTSRVEVFGSH